jgi:hypothetical protein
MIRFPHVATAALALALLVPAASADDAHHPEQAPPAATDAAPAAPQAENTGKGMGMGMQGPMQEMHARMQAMQAQMQRIHQTEDPQERARLLAEHQESMNQTMAQMESHMGMCRMMMQHQGQAEEAAAGETRTAQQGPRSYGSRPGDRPRM